MIVEKKRACKTVNRKIEMIKNEIKEDLEKAHKVVNQAWLLIEQKPCQDKILSIHEPHVVVIAKGKRGKRYEFGSKVAVSIDSNGFILSNQVYDTNIADIKTLEPALEKIGKTNLINYQKN